MWDDFKAFMSQPYRSEDMDAGDWFLFLGLILAIMVLWRVILLHIARLID